jgi:quercetin dioxygenase-like cupin family protein
MASKVVQLGGASLDDAVLDEVRAERKDSLSGPDSPEGREMGRAVGANVATLRKERAIDLDTMAERSGIRQDLLVALEGGRAVPSLRAVWHLATALRVPFGSLLANSLFSHVSDPDFRVQSAKRGRVIASADNQFRSRVLFREGDRRAPEVYELTLEPGCREEAHAHAPDVFEHLTVVTGELVVKSGDAEARLAPGDTLFFRADKAHSYFNPGTTRAVAHLVMSYAHGG